MQAKYYLTYFLLVFLLFPILSIGSSLNKENNFLVISDIHLNKSSSHVMDISPLKGNGENDLDQDTLKELLSSIRANIKNGVVAKPHFIILLGDIVGHLRTTPESVIESEAVVFNEVSKYFFDIPIFYVFGNNDSLKINYGPFKDQDQSSSLKSPYDVAKMQAYWWNGFLSTGAICQKIKNVFPCMITQNTKNGFYSAYLKHKFRLIVLNTVMFSPSRIQISEQAAMSQLRWLSEQLKLAKENRESVLIAMHIPPGDNVYDHSSFWLPKEQAFFLKIVRSYQSTIVGILASHTHAEELKVIKDELNKNISGVYFIAALSTSHGNEPSVKTFYFSKHHGRWQLANYETFHFTRNQSTLLFNKLYAYQNYYCDNVERNNLLDCLNNITPDKMKKYFSAGNVNYEGLMQSPADIFLMANSYHNTD